MCDGSGGGGGGGSSLSSGNWSGSASLSADQKGDGKVKRDGLTDEGRNAKARDPNGHFGAADHVFNFIGGHNTPVTPGCSSCHSSSPFQADQPDLGSGTGPAGDGR